MTMRTNRKTFGIFPISAAKRRRLEEQEQREQVENGWVQRILSQSVVAPEYAPFIDGRMGTFWKFLEDHGFESSYGRVGMFPMAEGRGFEIWTNPTTAASVVMFYDPRQNRFLLDNFTVTEIRKIPGLGEN